MRKGLSIIVFQIIFSLIFSTLMAVGEIKYFDAAGNNISESEWNEIVKQEKKLTPKENPSNDENSRSPNYGNNNKGRITNNDQSKKNKTKRNASVVKTRDTNSDSNQTVAKKSSDIHARNDVDNTQTSNQSLGSSVALPQISETGRQSGIAKTQAPINRVQSDEILTIIVICSMGLLLFLTVRYAIRKRDSTQNGKNSSEASEVEIPKATPIEIINPKKEKLTPQKPTINITTKIGDVEVYVDGQKIHTVKHVQETRENSKPEFRSVSANAHARENRQPEPQFSRIKRCRYCDCPAASGSDFCYEHQ
jgi:hypothetical protein